MNDAELERGYEYRDADLNHAHAYVLPYVQSTLAKFFAASPFERAVFDLGCGNGSVGSWLQQRGYGVTGVDPSAEGIAIARNAHPNIKVEVGSAYDDLAARFGTFPAIISIEVVEHVYAPRRFAKTAFDLVKPGGIAVLTTPYHGYFKNVAVAITGSFDKHVNPLWDHGHIKFWSIETLSQLLLEAGFGQITFGRVGRIPLLAKSLVAVARREG